MPVKQVVKGMVKVKPETVSTAAFAATVIKLVSGVHDTAFLKRPRMPRCACYTQQIPRSCSNWPQLVRGRQLDSERGCPGMPASMRTQFGLRPCPPQTSSERDGEGEA